MFLVQRNMGLFLKDPHILQNDTSGPQRVQKNSSRQTWVALEPGYQCCCSVAQACPTPRPHGLQHPRPPCPSPTPRVYSNSCPLSQRCHPTISSSVVPFSSQLQSFPASGSFQMSQLFTSGGQGMGASSSASVLPMNIQD